ncbi:tRNA N(3)-cytidine methyltransferase METTL8, mitochondrial isoform X4 [Rhinolophus sinicus]|uniref:tRNA N(3)-cytidine methyltransferase METTL8, mitochondrial isoform X4 n=1 Tax=Rhinolophus sinicus TaxID=89399 RepID=UPI003D7A2A12
MCQYDLPLKQCPVLKVLIRMSGIWRNSIFCLRRGKVPQRCQSGNPPVAPLGSRILTDPAKVFEHNMWDHMQWSTEEEAAARKKVEENSAVRVLLEEQDSEEHRKGPLKPEPFPGSNATFRILEVGCGAGNSVFPILDTLQNAPESFLYCCDFSSGAVELVKSHSAYRAAQCCAFVHDVCDDGLPYPFPDGILDVILLVFVLSSIHPDRMQGVVNRLSKLLKPGGMLLFRDYGRYDKTQLRFKMGHCLSENFYVRGDGTRAYFFTKGEVHNMFCKAGLDEKQNLVDRRLQVNRKKQVKMHRVWVQGKFQKPLHLTQKSSNLLFSLS